MCFRHSKSLIEEKRNVWQLFARMNRAVIYVLLGCYIAWRLYRRMRRSIGRQKLNPTRIIISLAIFGAACAFVVFIGVSNPQILIGFGGGVLPGALLGLLGLRLTRFETTEEGHFYKPDTRIGVAISLLLAGRVLYRLATLPNSSFGPGNPPPQPSPLTFLIVGLMFGYFLVYYIGLLVHTHDRK